MAQKPFATIVQKDAFKSKFADIVKQNEKLHQQYTIQFFDTAAKSNYVINSLNGKSMNVRDFLTIEEFDKYLVLKNHWQD